MTTNKKYPIRVLHVVGGMVRAGVETWLMHILRHLESDSLEMDFLVHFTEQCNYDEEIISRGRKIIPCMHPFRPWKYASNFKRILRQHGPYDVVHSHVHHYSGLVLRLARQAGVPKRIAHSHNDTRPVDEKSGLGRRLYLALMERWIKQNATAGLACSKQAAAALYGPGWESDKRWQVLNYGIDFNPFKTDIDPGEVRADLGIPPDAFVVGHVGRFEEQKNHKFLIEIAMEISKIDPSMRLLLVGDGSLRAGIESQVVENGLKAKVIFAGVRSDVPRLMRGAMDGFLFPSIYEGLAVVLVEAQAAGLPCVIADVVPGEADVVTPLVRRLSLAQPARAWAQAVLESRHTGKAVTPRQALESVEQSPFNIESSLKKLMLVYEEK